MRCGINNIFKKPLATLMVLCMLAVTLTACGNDEATEISESVQTAATETTESEANNADLKIDETVETITEETIETTTAPEAQSVTSVDNEQSGITEIKNGTYEEALTTYFECMNNGDFKGLADVTYPKGTYELLVFMTNQEGTDIDTLFSEMIIEEAESFPVYLDEIISAEPLSENTLSMMNEMFGGIALACSRVEQSGGFENHSYEEISEILMSINGEEIANYLNITEGYTLRFRCSNYKGETSEAEVYTYLIPSDGWKIDTSMIGYIQASKNLSADSSAKNIYNAANTVLTEIDIMGMSSNGTCVISSDSTKNYNADNSFTDEFYGRTANYYDEIKNYEYFVIISDNIVLASICYNKSDNEFVGTFPRDTLYLDREKNISIDVSSEEYTFDELYKLCIENLK